MNAPAGVDSDSSSGEDDISPPYSPVSPNNKPHFSLKALFLPDSKLKTSTQEKETTPAVNDQFVGSGVARAPSPIQLRAPKKKVRIHVNGEDHPDSPKDSGTESPLDLVASPISPMSIGDAGSPWAGAMSPISSPGGNGPPANEVFDLLRQLLVDQTRDRSQGGESGARLELADSSDTDQSAPPELRPPSPPSKEAKKIRKKPSRIMAKLSKLTSPRKTTHAPQEQLSNHSSSSFSATDGFSPGPPSQNPVSADRPAQPTTSTHTRPPKPPNSAPPLHPSSSDTGKRPGIAGPYIPYVDPSDRLPDGRKAHGLAEEYFHPERFTRSRQVANCGDRDADRQSLLPYLSPTPSPSRDQSRQIQYPQRPPWLQFPTPRPPGSRTLQPPHSAPGHTQQLQDPYSSPPQRQHDHTSRQQWYFDPPPIQLQQRSQGFYATNPDPPSSTQASNAWSSPQPQYQSPVAQPSQALYQPHAQPPHYAYPNYPSQAPYSPPWTAPAPGPGCTQWHSGYYPYHGPQAAPPHPPPFPHPPALQPWQPYYPPPGYPYAAPYPSLQPSVPYSTGQEPGRDRPNANPVDTVPQSPLGRLPNPHSPNTIDDREESAPALQADGLHLRPATEAKSPVRTRLHGLPGSIKVTVEDAPEDEAGPSKKVPSVPEMKGQKGESSIAPPAEPASESEDRLREVTAQREQLKKRIAAGKIDNEKGQQELGRLTKLRDQLQTTVSKAQNQTGTSKTNTDAAPSGPSKSASEDKQSTSGSSSGSKGRDPKDKLKLVIRQREELKKRIAEGKIGREKGKSELDRITKLRDQLHAANEAAKPSNPDSGVREAGPSTLSRDTPTAVKIRPDPSTESSSTSVEQLKARISEIEKQMVEVKSKILDKSLDREKGEQMLAKLDESRKKVRTALHAAEEGKGKQVAQISQEPVSESKADVPRDEKAKDARPKDTEHGDKLAQIDARMKRLRQRVKEGSLSKEDAEKEMRKLMKTREALATIPDGSVPKASRDTGRVKSEEGDDSLDPEILKQVLAEIPTSSSSSRKRSTSGNRDVRGPTSDAKGKSKASNSDPVEDADRSKSSRGRSDVPDPERTENGSTSVSARPSSMHIPGSWQDPSLQVPQPSLSLINTASSTEVTWSKCLVSLAHCIHLGQDLSAHLIRKHKNHELHVRDGGSFLVVEFLPRLLTSLFLQRDIVSSMRGILGEEHSQAMGAFLEHILVVKRFLEVQHARQKERALKKADDGQNIQEVESLHNSLISAFESGSLHAILEHLLGLSDFLTPQLLKTLRDVLEEWKEEGLSISSIIHIIMTLRKELNSASEVKVKRLKEDKPKVEPTGTLDLLDKLLRFIDGDGHKRKSIPYEQDNPPARDERRHRDQPSAKRNGESKAQDKHHEGIKEKVARVLHIDRKDDDPENRVEERPRSERSHDARHLERATSRTHETARPSRDTPPPADPRRHRSAQRARVEDASDSFSLPSVKSVHRDPHTEKDIKLPSLTEEFLRPSTESPPQTLGRNRGVNPSSTSKHDHHSSVVRPPGPAPEAKGSHHHAIIDPEEYPDLCKTLSRGYSSQSKYSQDSAGTIESDEEAKRLLAHADSGPQPVEEPEEELSEDLLPSDKQVRMAREVQQQQDESPRKAYRVI